MDDIRTGDCENSKKMRALFHVHTKYSFDSLQSAEDIVDWPHRTGMDSLFIVDHNTIGGCLKAKQYTEKNNVPVKVVIGSEVKTDIGDIIGIFLK